jgi:hypothetical protein
MVFVSEGSSHQKKLQGSATLQLLQAHGITMLPADDTTLVASAVESGQTVVLTGKCCEVYMIHVTDWTVSTFKGLNILTPCNMS